MQCLNPRRRFLTKEDPLVKLFKDMTVVKIVGRNGSNSAALGGYIDVVDSGSFRYVLSTNAQNVTLWKVARSGSTYTNTELLKTSTGSGFTRSTATGSTGRIYWRSVANANTGSTTSGSSAYGATLAEVAFPSYTEADVTSILGAATITGLAGRNNEVSTNSKSNLLILAVKAAYLDIWDGARWTRLGGTETAAASVSGSSLTIGSVYGGSIFGINPAS